MASPARGAPQRPSGRAVELAFLDDSLMRLVGALDAVLAVVALGRQELRDLVDAADPAAAIGPGRIVDGLADLEFVFAQGVLRGDEKARRPPSRRSRTPLPEGIHGEYYHGKAGAG